MHHQKDVFAFEFDGRRDGGADGSDIVVEIRVLGRSGACAREGDGGGRVIDER